MKPSTLSTILLAAVLVTAPLRAADSVSVEQAYPGMSFSLPVAITPYPGRTDAFFVVEKGDPDPAGKGNFFGGKIQLVEGLKSGQPTKRTVFQLQVKDGKFEAGGECGLLGLAVHPNVDKNGQVFVYYSLKINGKLHQRVSRFLVSKEKPFKIDPASEQPLVSQADPASNHNGGDLHFGPDGYLYFSCGDGGAGGDAFNTAGFINKGFHAAVYRIDVDKRPGNLPPNAHASVPVDAQGAAFYAVPADNPFVKATTHRGQALEPKSVRTETWATGLRNAWRFSFDPKTGACFTGDVGQNLYEEIDILVSGGDYGWSEVEADHIFNKKDASAKQGPAKPAAASAYVAPIYEYDRKLGGSVTGGVVCRSERIPAIRDAYVFGDYASGRLFAIKEKGGKWTGDVIAKDMTIAGFGHDPVNGDVLFVTLSGQLKRLAPKK